MTSDDQLPPRPAKSRERAFAPDAGTLPPVGYDHEDDDYQRGGRFGWFTGLYGLSPGMTTGVIFLGSFILGILLTSMILAGIIEVQPSAIKGFFKSIFGKS